VRGGGAKQGAATDPGCPASIAPMFKLGKPETAGQWMVHVVLGIIALALVAWMVRVFVL